MESDKTKILFVSKAISPPWNDSNKNLAKDIIINCDKYLFNFFTNEGSNLELPNGIPEYIYGDISQYSPSFTSKLKVFSRMFKKDGIPIYHFFFSPNATTSRILKYVMFLKRKITIQTILSSPKSYESINKLLFAKYNVALSHYNADMLKNSGVKNITVIPPGIESTKPTEVKEQEVIRKEFGFDNRHIVLFAGDYQFSDAADTILKAIPKVVREVDVVFVYACRLKQEKSKEIELKIKNEIQKLGLNNNVKFFNELENIKKLIAISSISIMPVNSLYAKMDIPMVLLESLNEKVPIIISNIQPLSEILLDDYGISILPSNSDALSEAIIKLINNKEKREYMGVMAKKVIEEHFNVRIMAERYERLYSSILDNYSNPKV